MAEERKITRLEGELREEVKQILIGNLLVSGGSTIVLPEIGGAISKSMVNARGYSNHYFKILRRDGENICDTEMRYSPEEDYVMEDTRTFFPGTPEYIQKDEELSRREI